MFLNLAQYLEKRMRKGSFFSKTDDCKIEPLKIPDELIAISPRKLFPSILFWINFHWD